MHWYGVKMRPIAMKEGFSLQSSMRPPETMHIHSGEHLYSSNILSSNSICFFLLAVYFGQLTLESRLPGPSDITGS